MNMAVLGFMLITWLGAAQVFASTPTEQIQETIQQVLVAVDSSSPGSESDRRARLRHALMPRFDWPEMAKQALGKHWNGVIDRQDEFIAAFADFLGNAYVGRIESYKDEKILFMHESIERNSAQVDTKIVPGKGEPTSVNYRLHRVRDEWKIYDVVVEDISIIGNYRSQFDRIITRGSFDDLLKRMRQKSL